MNTVKLLLVPLFVIWSVSVALSGTESNYEYIDMSKGDAQAKVTIVEYASFTCPHCATFHREVFPKLKAEFIDSGKVHFIYREVYFDAPGLWAGLIARCADETKYFGLVDLLYLNQDKWIIGSSETEILKNLVTIGSQAGLERKQIGECLRNEKKALNLVKAFQENAKKDGISSTPSFVINGQLYKNIGYESLKTEIENLLN